MKLPVGVQNFRLICPRNMLSARIRWFAVFWSRKSRTCLTHHYDSSTLLFLLHMSYTRTTCMYTHTTCMYTHTTCMYTHTTCMYTRTTCMYTRTTCMYTHTTCMYTHTTCMYTHTTCMYTRTTCMYTHTTCMYTHTTCMYTHTTCMYTHTTCMYKRTGCNLIWPFPKAWYPRVEFTELSLWLCYVKIFTKSASKIVHKCPEGHKEEFDVSTSVNENGSGKGNPEIGTMMDMALRNIFNIILRYITIKYLYDINMNGFNIL